MEEVEGEATRAGAEVVSARPVSLPVTRDLPAEDTVSRRGRVPVPEEDSSKREAHRGEEVRPRVRARTAERRIT
jgi:hypothetical protein